MINFPIHRVQEYIPFIIICSLIISNNIKSQDNYSNSYGVFILLLLIIPSSLINFKEHKSLEIQGKILFDYDNNTFNINRNELSQINYSRFKLSKEFYKSPVVSLLFGFASCIRAFSD